VPKLLAAFERGIPHKVEADKQGALVYFGYTEVGELGGWKVHAAANSPTMQDRFSVD
jgi:hypothetical protein